MELEIPENTWLKGEFVKDKGIKSVTMVKEEPKGTQGDFGFKVEATIKFEGQGKEDPNKISWNVTSARLLKKFLGANTMQWLDKEVPIEASRTEKGYAIYADEKALEKLYGGAN